MRRRSNCDVCPRAGTVVAVLGALLMIMLRYQLPRIYTDDSDVIEVVTDFMPLAAVNFVFSSFNYVLQGRSLACQLLTTRLH